MHHNNGSTGAGREASLVVEQSRVASYDFSCSVAVDATTVVTEHVVVSSSLSYLIQD